MFNKSFILIIALAFNIAFAGSITSKNKFDSSAILSTEMDGTLFLNLCSDQNGCQLIGSTDGYTVDQLKKIKMKVDLIAVGIGTANTIVAGGLTIAGTVVGSKFIFGGAKNLTGVFYAFFVGPVVAGCASLTGSIFLVKWLNGLLNVMTIKRARMVSKTLKIVIKDQNKTMKIASMPELASDLQYVLTK